MTYRMYKTSYPDCETVRGSYDASSKQITVLIPEGRMKPSGVRGERFRTIWLHVGKDADHVYEQGFRAVCETNAIRQAVKLYPYCEEAAR
jgi:hypothetical protein